MALINFRNLNHPLVIIPGLNLVTQFRSLHFMKEIPLPLTAQSMRRVGGYQDVLGSLRYKLCIWQGQGHYPGAKKLQVEFTLWLTLKNWSSDRTWGWGSTFFCCYNLSLGEGFRGPEALLSFPETRCLLCVWSGDITFDRCFPRQPHSVFQIKSLKRLIGDYPKQSRASSELSSWRYMLGVFRL